MVNVPFCVGGRLLDLECVIAMLCSFSTPNFFTLGKYLVGCGVAFTVSVSKFLV